MAKSKLAVIMFSDIVGYTAIMEKDENEALRTIKANRETHIQFLQKHDGVLIKEIGDGLLMTFESVTEAIQCAKSIQTKTIAEDFSIRIGIHLGEIITQNSDVLGDGVNLASRIEQAADPGTIFISDSVFKSIQNKIGIKAIPVGERKLKNIKEVVQLYRVQLDNESPGTSIPNRFPGISWSKLGMVAIPIALFLTWLIFLPGRSASDRRRRSQWHCHFSFYNSGRRIYSIPTKWNGGPDQLQVGQHSTNEYRRSEYIVKLN